MGDYSRCSEETLVLGVETNSVSVLTDVKGCSARLGISYEGSVNHACVNHAYKFFKLEGRSTLTDVGLINRRIRCYPCLAVYKCLLNCCYRRVGGTSFTSLQ